MARSALGWIWPTWASELVAQAFVRYGIFTRVGPNRHRRFVLKMKKKFGFKFSIF
jgi:hypothetical protein